MTDIIRQGDILLVPRKLISENKQKLKEIGKNEKILASGQILREEKARKGHYHVLSKKL